VFVRLLLGFVEEELLDTLFVLVLRWASGYARVCCFSAILFSDSFGGKGKNASCFEVLFVVD